MRPGECQLARLSGAGGGPVAHTLGEAFAGPGVTVLRGECEQLLWKFDAVLADTRTRDRLWAGWPISTRCRCPTGRCSGPGSFAFRTTFRDFPRRWCKPSRGCTLSCNYCPYIVIEKSHPLPPAGKGRGRNRRRVRRHGFRSFKFRDPLFGVDRRARSSLADRLGRLPQDVQFSIESRIDLLREDTLRALAQAGLTSITFGIETPDEATLRRYRRAPIRDDRQRDFIELCRRLGIRTVAGFMIGFPEDTAERIEAVLRYARR